MVESGPMANRAVTTALATAAIAALLLGSIASLARDAAGSRWREMQTWVRGARAEQVLRDFRRPAAFGDTEGGDAFVHYRHALRLGSPLTHDAARRADLFDLWHGRLAGADREVVRSVWAPAIAAMRRGAHSGDARPPDDCDRFDFLVQSDLVYVAMAESRLALDTGDARGAAGLLLDAAAMLLDFPANVFTAWTFDRLLHDGLTDDWLRRCDPAALDLLAAGLQRLDARAPWPHAVADAVLASAERWLGELSPLDFDVGHRCGWRFAGARQWMAADAVMTMASALRHDGGAMTPWPQRQRELAAVQQAEASRPNPMSLTWCWRLEEECRRATAELGVLRLAVDWHRGEALPVLRDPLGDGPIAVDTVPGGVEFATSGAHPVRRTALRR